MILFSELSSDFQIVDYACTHCQLLLRSNKNRNRSFNIDILFKPVKTMLIPSYMKGMEISIDDFPDMQTKLINEYAFKISTSYKIFRLKDAEGRSFYINAMAFSVFHNKQITPIESGLKDGQGGYLELFGDFVMGYPPECK